MPAAGQSVQEVPATLSAQDAAARHVELGLRFYRAGSMGRRASSLRRRMG